LGGAASLSLGGAMHGPGGTTVSAVREEQPDCAYVIL